MPKETQKIQKVLVGVFGIPINKQGQFLLTQRNDPENPQSHLQWQFAGGGIDFGEEILKTLVLEFQEEIGVTPKVLYELPIVDSDTNYGSPTQNDYHVVLIFYIVDIGNQKIKLDDTETLNWKWCSLAEIKTMSCLGKVEVVAQKAQQIIDKERLLELL
jgi:8-oxo-dGTP pyrophosphatase MutT (NUDIX family)